MMSNSIWPWRSVRDALYFGHMRFHCKFGWVGWLMLALAGMNLIESLFTLHRFGRLETADLISITCLGLCALLAILSKIFVYWDLDATGLHANRFWVHKDVAWPEVALISQYSNNPDCFAIHYSWSPPMSNQGKIWANPADRAGFLAALRRFAPQAEFWV